MAERRLAGMRADHWKRAGDEALGRGEGARARELYGRCLEARGAPGGSPAGEPRGARELWEGEAVVRSNRSLALCRAGRFEEALADAERAARHSAKDRLLRTTASPSHSSRAPRGSPAGDPPGAPRASRHRPYSSL